tara:strand:+ start:613 stop:1371 length:759 start_codon:yes stop_codon:yes gene_type:complete
MVQKKSNSEYVEKERQMSYMKSRERKFEMWWKKNHHKKQGQVWLCKSAKRIAFAYNLHPSAFDDVRFICKRFFSSEHMRLRKADAWKLYKLCNPLHTERLKRLQTTAEHLDALKRESGDGLQHPLWIGKPKQKKSLSEFLSGKPDNKDVPSAEDILDQLRKRRVVNGKLKYEDYVTGKNVYYPDSITKTTLAQDILQKIDIVQLVEEAVKFGIDNHDKYGDERQTKEVIACSPLSLLFKILGDLNLAYTGDE